MRTPGLSTSATVASGDRSGTAYTPSISTYGAVKATSSARAGSIPRKQMSARPVSSAASESRAAWKQRNSTPTTSRAAISRPISTVTPVGATEVPWASTGLPRLMAARSAPLGARSLAIPTDPSPMRAGYLRVGRQPGIGRGCFVPPNGWYWWCE